MEKKGDVGRGHFEQKSIEEKQDFTLAELGGVPFLVGDTQYIFSCWDLLLIFFPLEILLLGSVIDSSCH